MNQFQGNWGDAFKNKQAGRNTGVVENWLVRIEILKISNDFIDGIELTIELQSLFNRFIRLVSGFSPLTR